MESKVSFASLLTLLGIVGLVYSIVGMINSYLTPGILAGIVLVGTLLFFSGITIILDKLKA